MLLKNCEQCDWKISDRLYQLNNWICNTCLNKPKPVDIIEDSINHTKLPTYTASQLVHKHNKNYNSILNERCCIKVWDKYILHEDIIKYYKNLINSSIN